MGKSFRQRIKKRKTERSKHRRPQAAASNGVGSRSRNPTSPVVGPVRRFGLEPPSFSSSSSLLSVLPVSRSASLLVPERIKRSPVLSRYLNPESHVLVVGDGDFSFGRALLQLRSKYKYQPSQLEKHSTDGSEDDDDCDDDGDDIDNDDSIGGFLTVTGYDSRKEALRKYANPKASSQPNNNSNKKTMRDSNTTTTGIEKSLQIIEEGPNATILYSIDATKLNEQIGPNGCSTKESGDKRDFYDVVIFNFPHSGQQRVHLNRNLIYEFFQSVRTLFLAQDDHNQREQQQQQLQGAKPGHGRPRRHSKRQRIIRQVHVTIKNQRPYIHWGIESSAQAAGFFLNPSQKNKVPFDMPLWNSLGYRHQTTVGPQQATSQPQLLAKVEDSEAKLAQTWIFDFESDHHHHHHHHDNGRPLAAMNQKLAPSESNPKSSQKDAPTIKVRKEPTATSEPNQDHTKRSRQKMHTKQSPAVDITHREIQHWVEKREEARQGRNWTEADRIRDLLHTEYKVVLCDQKVTGTTWSKHPKPKDERPALGKLENDNDDDYHAVAVFQKKKKIKRKSVIVEPK